VGFSEKCVLYSDPNSRRKSTHSSYISFSDYSFPQSSPKNPSNPDPSIFQVRLPDAIKTSLLGSYKSVIFPGASTKYPCKRPDCTFWLHAVIHPAVYSNRNFGAKTNKGCGVILTDAGFAWVSLADAGLGPRIGKGRRGVRAKWASRMGLGFDPCCSLANTF
jgi:hypothetical protein